MKITKTTKHGQPRWKVDLGRRENGQRVRKLFHTRVDAETFANRHKEGVRENGQKWARHFAWLSVHEQAEMMRQHERLSHLGYTLREAVDFIAASRKPAPSVPLETAVNEFISIKEARGLRDRSFRKVRASVRMFCDQTSPQLPLRSITEAHVQDFLARNGWKPATRKTYLGDVKAFFRWCVRRKLVADSPAENVEAPLMEDEPPGIVTVAPAKAVLSACQRERPSLLGWLALCLFAGMRPEEARRLTWENIVGKYVEVAGAKAKTRQRRACADHGTTPRLAGRSPNRGPSVGPLELAKEIRSRPRSRGRTGKLAAQRLAPRLCQLSPGTTWQGGQDGGHHGQLSADALRALPRAGHARGSAGVLRVAARCGRHRRRHRAGARGYGRRDGRPPPSHGAALGKAG